MLIAVLLGTVVGLAFAVVIGRINAPSFSPLGAVSVLVIIIAGISFGMNGSPNVQFGATIAGVLAAVASPFATAYFLRENPAWDAETYANRLKAALLFRVQKHEGEPTGS